MDALNTLLVAAVQLQSKNFDAAAKLMLEAADKPDLVAAVRSLIKASSDKATSELTQLDQTPIDASKEEPKAEEPPKETSDEEITPLDEEVHPDDSLDADQLANMVDEGEEGDADEPAQPEELPLSETDPNYVKETPKVSTDEAKVEDAVVDAEDSLEKEASKEAPVEVEAPSPTRVKLKSSLIKFNALRTSKLA